MSDALKTELVNFSELTGDASIGRRAELARHVASLFAMTSDRCSEEQIDIYDSVLLRLVGMVEVEVRRFVAEQMCNLARGPEETIRCLADDDIEVAEPVLLRSAVLKDRDLVEIAAKHGNSHCLAIAQREGLTERVTDVLVEKGDINVKRKVASNAGAAFSESGMSILISDASADASLQFVLSERNDLREAQIADLVAVASGEVRKKLLEAGREKEVERLDEASEVAAENISNQYWLGRYDFETARNRVALLAKRGMVNEATLRRFASEDRFAEAVATIAWLVRCGVDEASQWMVGPDPTPFVTLAKASGFSSFTVGSLLSIGPWRQRLTPETRSQAMALFDKMSVAEAKRKMAHWNYNVLH